MVHSSGVGAPMIPRGTSYTPSAEVQSTTASHNNDIAIVVIWRISFESFTRRRRRAPQRDDAGQGLTAWDGRQTTVSIEGNNLRAVFLKYGASSKEYMEAAERAQERHE